MVTKILNAVSSAVRRWRPSASVGSRVPWQRAAMITYATLGGNVSRKTHERRVRLMWKHRHRDENLIALMCGVSVDMIRRIREIFNETPGFDGPEGSAGVPAVRPRTPVTRTGRA